MTSPGRSLRNWKEARFCRQGLKGKKDLGLLGMYQEDIAGKLGKQRLCASGFMQMSGPGGRAGFGRRLGGEDFQPLQVEEMVATDGAGCVSRP